MNDARDDGDRFGGFSSRYEDLRWNASPSTPDVLVRLMTDLMDQHTITAHDILESHNRTLTCLALMEGEDTHDPWMIFRASLDQQDTVRGMGMQFSLNGLEGIGFAIRTYINAGHFPPEDEDYDNPQEEPTHE